MPSSSRIADRHSFPNSGLTAAGAISAARMSPVVARLPAIFLADRVGVFFDVERNDGPIFVDRGHDAVQHLAAARDGELDRARFDRLVELPVRVVSSVPLSVMAPGIGRVNDVVEDLARVAGLAPVAVQEKRDAVIHEELSKFRVGKDPDRDQDSDFPSIRETMPAVSAMMSRQWSVTRNPPAGPPRREGAAPLAAGGALAPSGIEPEDERRHELRRRMGIRREAGGQAVAVDREIDRLPDALLPERIRPTGQKGVTSRPTSNPRYLTKRLLRRLSETEPSAGSALSIFRELHWTSWLVPEARSAIESFTVRANRNVTRPRGGFPPQ